MCYCCRPGSIRRMLSAGNASASSEAKATSSGIFSWDCAYSSHQKALLLFPLESPPFSHPDWKGYLRKNSLSFHLAKELYYWRNLYQQPEIGRASCRDRELVGAAREGHGEE